jgi:hypothetical protein
MHERIIKLIWDFRGDDSLETAEHHQQHLSDYLKKNGYKDKTGTEKITEDHAIAWLATSETNMIKLRDALIPHRAEVFEEDH